MHDKEVEHTVLVQIWTNSLKLQILALHSASVLWSVNKGGEKARSFNRKAKNIKGHSQKWDFN